MMHTLAGRFYELRASFGKQPAMRLLADVSDDRIAEEVSYAELAQRIGQTATLLKDMAGKNFPRVALIVPNTPSGQIALWGAEIAGIAVPLNPLLMSDHQLALVRAAGIDILIVATDQAKKAALESFSPVCEIISLGELEHSRRGCADALCMQQHNDPDRLVAMFHTGGTTGIPKLARHMDRNQMSAGLGCAKRVGLSSDDIVLNPLPLFHVAGSIAVGLAAILSGACQLFPTELGGRAHGFYENFWTMISQQGVTTIAGVPTIFSGAITHVPEHAPPCLRRVMVGGALLPTVTEDRLQSGLGLKISNVLGMTECAGMIAAGGTEPQYVPGWIGPAVDGVEIRIVRDPFASSNELPPHSVGHVLVRGATVGPGYVDEVQNSGLFNADGWLVTGDLGKLDEVGRLCLTGRAKDLIIRSGHNIDPRLIEEAALSLDNVELAAAVGAPDSYAGEVPFLFVQLHHGKELQEEVIQKELASKLEKPATPKKIIQVSHMPLTAAGKIYKPALSVMATQIILDQIFRKAEIPSTAWKVTDEGGTPLVTIAADYSDTACDLMNSLLVKYRAE